MSGKTKILIVDDSVLVRKALQQIFSLDDELEVIGTAADPYEAAKLLRNKVPDVITLDIEMPKMDGLTFLQKLMQQHPIPVVIISTRTEKGTETAIKALEYGAAEIMVKPKLGSEEEINENARRLIEVVKGAARANLKLLKRDKGRGLLKREKPAGIEDPELKKINRSNYLIALGASTGGTEAIKNVLQGLPSNIPGIVIVQHMPVGFTNQFANRLNQVCHLNVKEAEDGDKITPGWAFLAPGNKHLKVVRGPSGLVVQLSDGEGPVNRHMPSVDVLFDSVARTMGKKAIGCIMTGMGRDGAVGLLEMKTLGGQTVAQDEASSVVFGMPKKAIELEAVDRVVSLQKIPSTIVDLIKSRAIVKK